VPRPKGSKNKNKKSLVAWLESHQWRFEEKFRDAFAKSAPEEQLRCLTKMFPFMFQRVDNTPLVEVDVNLHVQGISSPKELMNEILKDPMVDMKQILDAHVIENKGDKDARGRLRSSGDTKAESGTGDSEEGLPGSSEAGDDSSDGEELVDESGERDSK